MEPTIIGIKQLHKDLTKVAMAAQKGKSFIVVKYAKPVFRIEPVRTVRAANYTLDDFKKIRFSSAYPNLSKHIDRYVYGV